MNKSILQTDVLVTTEVCAVELSVMSQILSIQ